MNRAAAFRPVALLLALSVLLLGAGAPHASCGGACCGADRAASHAWAGQAQRVSADHACCCGTGAVPCDLEQAPAPDLPDSAMGSTPRVDAPASAAVFVSAASQDVVLQRGRALSPLSPSAQGPPGPLYLRTQAFLC